MTACSSKCSCWANTPCTVSRTATVLCPLRRGCFCCESQDKRVNLGEVFPKRSTSVRSFPRSFQAASNPVVMRALCNGACSFRTGSFPVANLRTKRSTLVRPFLNNPIQNNYGRVRRLVFCGVRGRVADKSAIITGQGRVPAVGPILIAAHAWPIACAVATSSVLTASRKALMVARARLSVLLLGRTLLVTPAVGASHADAVAPTAPAACHSVWGAAERLAAQFGPGRASPLAITNGDLRHESIGT